MKPPFALPVKLDLDHISYIETADGAKIGYLAPATLAQEAFILHAINYHDRLKEVLQRILDAEARCNSGRKEDYAAACAERIDAMLGADNLLRELK